MAKMNLELAKLEALTKQQPSLQMFQGALEVISDPIIIVDITFNIVHANSQTMFVFGYKLHELIGQHVNLLIPDTLKEIHSQHLSEFERHPHARAMKGGVELLAKRKNGSELKCRVQIAPYTTEYDSYVCAQIRIL
jgi:PAS domain S-box-containing protein